MSYKTKLISSMLEDKIETEEINISLEEYENYIGNEGLKELFDKIKKGYNSFLQNRKNKAEEYLINIAKDSKEFIPIIKKMIDEVDVNKKPKEKDVIITNYNYEELCINDDPTKIIEGFNNIVKIWKENNSVPLNEFIINTRWGKMKEIISANKSDVAGVKNAYNEILEKKLINAEDIISEYVKTVPGNFVKLTPPSTSSKTINAVIYGSKEQYFANLYYTVIAHRYHEGSISSMVAKLMRGFGKSKPHKGITDIKALTGKEIVDVLNAILKYIDAVDMYIAKRKKIIASTESFYNEIGKYFNNLCRDIRLYNECSDMVEMIAVCLLDWNHDTESLSYSLYLQGYYTKKATLNYIRKCIDNLE